MPNRFQPVMSKSIYRDFSPWRSISLGLAAKLGHKLAVLFRFDLERVLVEYGGGVALAPDGRLAVLGEEGMATFNGLPSEAHRAQGARARGRHVLSARQRAGAGGVGGWGPPGDPDPGELRQVQPLLQSQPGAVQEARRGARRRTSIGSGAQSLAGGVALRVQVHGCGRLRRPGGQLPGPAVLDPPAGAGLRWAAAAGSTGCRGSGAARRVFVRGPLAAGPCSRYS